MIELFMTLCILGALICLQIIVEALAQLPRRRWKP
jgi:hypothetical protein